MEVGKLVEHLHERAGQFFRGAVSLDAVPGKILILPTAKHGERSPDFVVKMERHNPTTGEVIEPVVAGAAWWQVGQRDGLKYLSVKFQRPEQPKPIRCAAFFRTEGASKGLDLPPVEGREWRLVWRPPGVRPVADGAEASPDLDDDIPF
ncbi:uncharacterized protein (DUF736 family) [Constrictibacter sp. MBR-5]|jgi:uncharacterized protein (DUF736 family)|uniref:DUF736 family protein n=1 Tax=Constrictibacter sp. MBR-5 TaxID=3156467 RepID=UPI0033956421